MRLAGDILFCVAGFFLAGTMFAMSRTHSVRRQRLTRACLIAIPTFFAFAGLVVRAW